jgi:hypothetical protein
VATAEVVGGLMRAADFVYEVRDKSLEIVGQIHPEDIDIEIADVHNGVGNWKLKLPVEHPMVEHLRTPGSGIVVTQIETGEVLFSGPTRKPELEVTVEDPGGTYTFEGDSDNVHMAERLAVPDPTNPDLDEQGLAHDTRTGPIEDLMYEFVNANAGPGAPTARRVPHLVMGTSQGRGPVIKKSTRFAVLGNLLNDLAAGTMFRWRVRQVGSELRFEVTEATDRTKEIRLDIRNNMLASYKVASTAPGVTRVLVAGQGELVDRQFLEMTTPEAIEAEELWGRRIERFVDQRQTNDLEELERAGLEVLKDDGFASFAVQAVPMEDTGAELLRDWFPGDLVTVVIEGQETTSLVTGYVLKADSNGFRIGATLGDPAGFDPNASLGRQVSKLENRISNLERNAEVGQPPILLIGEALPESALPEEYPEGLSFQNVGSGMGWTTPGTFGTVVTYQGMDGAPPRTYQEFIGNESFGRWYRRWDGNNDRWGVWTRVVTDVVAIRYQPVGTVQPGLNQVLVTISGGRAMPSAFYTIAGFASEKNDGTFGDAVIRLESAVPVSTTQFRCQITNEWHTPLSCFISYTLTPTQG